MQRRMPDTCITGRSWGRTSPCSRTIRFFSPPGQEKHLTGRALTFRMDSNPLAGAFWFERMKADHMQDILEEARNVANGK